MTLTFKQLQAEVKRMDPNVDPASRTFRVAVIMLAALVVGANERKIVAFTGYDAAEVRLAGVNLRRSGIWKRGRTCSEWAHPEHGGLAFWIDTAVAEGLVQREPASPGGNEASRG